MANKEIYELLLVGRKNFYKDIQNLGTVLIQAISHALENMEPLLKNIILL